jgi:hypothetical protein
MRPPLTITIPRRLGKQAATVRLNGLSDARATFGRLLKIEGGTWNGDCVEFGKGQRASSSTAFERSDPYSVPRPLLSSVILDPRVIFGGSSGPPMGLQSGYGTI